MTYHLFSSVIGATLEGKPVKDLGVSFHDALFFLEKYLDTDLAPAAVIYGLKLCQLMKGQNAYWKAIRNEVMGKPEKYLEQVAGNLKTLLDSLKGVRYQVGDMWDELEANLDREDTVIFLAPPVYSAKDYPNMFNTREQISYHQPSIRNFDPKTDYPKLYDMVKDRAALTILYKIDSVEPEALDNVVFAAEMKKSTGKFGFMLSNRPEECKKLVAFQKMTELRPSKYPLIPEDHEVTEKSTITFVKADTPQAMYYRTLLCHRFGTTVAEQYLLAILDGYMWGICGFHLADLYTGKRPVLYETFGFSVPLEKYRHSHKLLNMVLVTEQFRDLMVQMNPKLELAEIEKFQTTCLTKFPSLSHQRGITKLRDRVQLPDGTYKLIYESEFKPMTFKSCIKQWLEKENNHAG